MVSQLMHHLGAKLLKTKAWSRVDYTGKPELGRYLKEKIFQPGKSLRWDELLRQATGESLNPKYFAEQFVR